MEEGLWQGPERSLREQKVVPLMASKRAGPSAPQRKEMSEEPDGAWKQIHPSRDSR